eukprot:SAG31_NODE_5366_length_2583_cov_12.509259_1_plen_75_part_00
MTSPPLVACIPAIALAKTKGGYLSSKESPLVQLLGAVAVDSLEGLLGTITVHSLEQGLPIDRKVCQYLGAVTAW